MNYSNEIKTGIDIFVKLLSIETPKNQQEAINLVKERLNEINKEKFQELQDQLEIYKGKII